MSTTSSFDFTMKSMERLATSLGSGLLSGLQLFGLANWIFLIAVFLVSGPVVIWCRYYDSKGQIQLEKQPTSSSKKGNLKKLNNNTVDYNTPLLQHTSSPSASSSTEEQQPSVVIFRPLKGIDASLQKNLESSFQQDYGNFEIVFSCEGEDDPAVAVARGLMGKFPGVKATIVLGLENVGINPKVNNLVKGYNLHTSDILWILDSNVRTEPGCLRRSVQIFLKDPRVGLVHHVPCAVELSSFGSYLDGVFLNCTHARMYSIINAFHVTSCIIGKSNLFWRKDVDRVGGLSAFGKYMSEDNMIGVAMMSLGKRHEIAPDFAYQSIGSVSVQNFLQRRVRWLRIRKYVVTGATVYEPFSECLIAGMLGGLGFSHYFGVNFLLFNVFHWMLWFISDMIVAKASYGSRIGKVWYDFPEFIMGWFVLQLLVLPSYVYAMLGDEITWRGQRYLLQRDGSCREIVEDDDDSRGRAKGKGRGRGKIVASPSSKA